MLQGGRAGMGEVASESKAGIRNGLRKRWEGKGGAEATAAAAAGRRGEEGEEEKGNAGESPGREGVADWEAQ